MPFTFSGTSVDRLDRYFTVETYFREAADAVDAWVWMAPFYAQLVGMREVHAVASSEATATASPRKITADAVAPGAAAGATVIELTAAALDMDSTANTVVTPTLASTDVCHLRPGNRLAIDFSATQTALAGSLWVFVFERL